MIKPFLLSAIVLALAAACSSGPTTCAEAACDPDTQFCRFFGSDTLAPSTATCADLPEVCAAARTCDCLLAEEADTVATCRTDGDLLVVTIPGG
jgi:hypothetical protein